MVPVQGCQQGNMPVMQGQEPAWFGAQWIPEQQMCSRLHKRDRVLVVLVPGGPRSGGFEPGNLLSGPVGATFEGLTPQAVTPQLFDVLPGFGVQQSKKIKRSSFGSREP